MRYDVYVNGCKGVPTLLRMLTQPFEGGCRASMALAKLFRSFVIPRGTLVSVFTSPLSRPTFLFPSIYSFCLVFVILVVEVYCWAVPSCDCVLICIKAYTSCKVQTVPDIGAMWTLPSRHYGTA